MYAIGSLVSPPCQEYRISSNTCQRKMIGYGFQDEIFRLNAASNRVRPIFVGRLLFKEIQYLIIQKTCDILIALTAAYNTLL